MPYRYRPRYRPRYRYRSSFRGRWGRRDCSTERERRNRRNRNADDDSPFKVHSVDFDVSGHNTEKFRYHAKRNTVIVRRGQEFKIEVKVDKPFNINEDDIRLQFIHSFEEPSQSKGTMFIINPGKRLDPEEASAVFDGDVRNSGRGYVIGLKVCLPNDCGIGRFQINIRLRNNEKKSDDTCFTTHAVNRQFIVLFNPWCRRDTVYLDDEDERREYVLNDKGCIFVGSASSNRPRPWFFGQFNRDILDVALEIVDDKVLSTGNPIRISRALSAVVNSNDESGVLTGNWSGNYGDETAPTEWTGSVAILQKYKKTKEPVEYGQCWVFSGVLTTVSRALGLPTRSVTNFDSAHDTNMSMTIDRYINKRGKPLRGGDSIWNFHVWNECWMLRPDLPDGNDGWQAFDSTPQELSEGVMRCGPAPVAAIKNGNVHLGDDTKFVFGEVNGDYITWMVSWSGDREVIKVDKDRVGRLISTKAVGRKNKRNDITDNYKHPEGSIRERNVVKNVVQHSSSKTELKKYYDLNRAHDVDMSFHGDMKNNADADFVFKAKNTSNERRTVRPKFTVSATYYTGATGDDIMKKKTTMRLNPGEEKEFSWTMKAADWINDVDEDAIIGAFVCAKVNETDQRHAEENRYPIDKPDLKMEISKSRVKVGETVEVEISFENPLEIPLTRPAFHVEGAGMEEEQQIRINSEIGPGEKITRKLNVTPDINGEHEIIASFHSRQLVDICGCVELDVEE